MVNILENGRLRRDSNHCWIIDKLPENLLEGGSIVAPSRSPYILLENGVSLPVPFNNTNDIRSLGLGRYNHWGKSLYFSTSDNSDPRENGRVYELVLSSTYAPQKNKRWVEPQRDLKTAFLVGCGRSGTTILFDALKGNNAFAPTFGYPDGEDHDGWISHGGAAICGTGFLDKAHGLTGGSTCTYMSKHDADEAVKKSMNIYYYNEVMKCDDNRMALNKNPHLSNKMAYVLECFPQALFIQPVRDPIYVVASWLKIVKQYPQLKYSMLDTQYPCLSISHQPEQATSLESKEHIVELFSSYWKLVNKGIIEQMSATPEILLTIKYEDFCADPMAILENVCAFLKVEIPHEIPEWLSISKRKLHDDELSLENIKRIQDITAPISKLFGY